MSDCIPGTSRKKRGDHNRYERSKSSSAVWIRSQLLDFLSLYGEKDHDRGG